MHRAIVYGRWAPYVDATPVRSHIDELRAAGIGIDQIATLAGMSSSHVRALIYPRSDGRPPFQKIRPETALRLLAVWTDTANRARHSRVDATGTRRRLQALIAVGWTHTQLAAELHRSPANLRRSMISDAVTAHTADQVVQLYERLWDVAPPCRSRAERRASTAARTRAATQGWPAPLAWDDIDKDPDPPSSEFDGSADMDEVAIERAMAGDVHVRLNHAEQVEAVRRLTERGRSIHAIAETLATSPRTVSRHRRRANAA